VRRWARQLVTAARLAVPAYGRHASSQLAAAISYRVLFSIVPLVTLLLTILDMVLPDDTRSDFVNWLFGVVPGDEVEQSVDRSLRQQHGASAPLVGLVALGFLLWSASGMMSALRTAMRVIWEGETGAPFVGGKLIDFALVLGAGLLLLAAFAASVVLQVLVGVGDDLSRALGWEGEGRLASAGGEFLIGAAAVFVALLALYRLLPPVKVRLADIWPAALLAAVSLQAAMAGFSVYLTRFADWSAVYGPLGAVLAFLVLIYVAATVMLVGAELAAAWPRARPAEAR
jgi:membrane protein